MPIYIALLRGINVSGTKRIQMLDLQTHFVSAGAVDVRTYIQSGNVVFRHRERSPAQLRKILEEHLATKFGCNVPTLVKTSCELAAIAVANPFDPSLPEFGKRMHVCFFERTPTQAAVADIQPWTSKSERLVIKSDTGYAYYVAGLGRARLGSATIERKLGTVTLRNWNTVTALLELAGVR